MTAVSAFKRTSTGAGRVLVVEDDEGIRDMLRYNLASAGFAVHEAADGASGLRTARTSSPDLILLDLMLPGMSGLDFCRAVRKTSRVPIIMLTAKDSEVDKIVGLKLVRSRRRCRTPRRPSCAALSSNLPSHARHQSWRPSARSPSIAQRGVSPSAAER